MTIKNWNPWPAFLTSLLGLCPKCRTAASRRYVGSGGRIALHINVPIATKAGEKSRLTFARFGLDVLNHPDTDEFGVQNHRAITALGNFEQALFERDFERQQVN